MKDSVYYVYKQMFKKYGEEPPSRSISKRNPQRSRNFESDDGSSSSDSLVGKPVGVFETGFNNPIAFHRG